MVASRGRREGHACPPRPAPPPPPPDAENPASLSASREAVWGRPGLPRRRVVLHGWRWWRGPTAPTAPAVHSSSRPASKDFAGPTSSSQSRSGLEAGRTRRRASSMIDRRHNAGTKITDTSTVDFRCSASPPLRPTPPPTPRHGCGSTSSAPLQTSRLRLPEARAKLSESSRRPSRKPGGEEPPRAQEEDTRRALQ